MSLKMVDVERRTEDDVRTSEDADTISLNYTVISRQSKLLYVFL